MHILRANNFDHHSIRRRGVCVSGRFTHARLQFRINLVPYWHGGDCVTVTLEQRFSVGIVSPRERSKSSVGCARLDIIMKTFKVFHLQRLVERNRAYMREICQSPNGLNCNYVVGPDQR